MTTDVSDLMRIPIARMIARWPLFGAIVASWEIVSGFTPTMGIGMGRCGLRLYVNPDFVLKLSLEQTITVLHHEVRHVIYGHIYQSPGAFADPTALTIAQEVTVNENLPGPLPGKPVLLASFPRLPADEDTLTRYRRLEVLVRDPEKQDADGDGNKISMPTGSGPGNPPPMKPGCASPEDKPDNEAEVESDVNNGSPSSDEDEDEPLLDEDQERTPKASKGTHHKKGVGKSHSGSTTRPSPITLSPEALASHDHWDEIQDQEALIRQQIEATAQQVQDAVIAERTKLDPTETTILKSILEQGATIVGEFSRIKNDGRAEVDWRQQLRRWVGKQSALTPTYQHPPRRFPHLLGIVPGKRRLPKRPRVLVAIDTSGSISDSQLEDFCAELAKLAQGREIWVAEVDAEVQKLYRYKGRITMVVGRGGTSFQPVFEPPILRRIRPDLVIYLTDGG